jgi:hypothetical protein
MTLTIYFNAINNTTSSTIDLGDGKLPISRFDKKNYKNNIACNYYSSNTQSNKTTHYESTSTRAVVHITLKL